MATLIILTVVILSSSAITVLVLYAIGKIRNLEEATNALMAKAPSPNSERKRGAGPFNGLQGKVLWEILTEKNIPSDVRRSDIDLFREQYAPVLLKTIKTIFSEGASDHKFGKPRSTPKNERPIKTLRHSIDSWLPSHELSILYNTGYDSVSAESHELSRLRATLEEVIGGLYSSIKSKTPAGLADNLMSESTAEPTADDENLNAPRLDTDGIDTNELPVRNDQQVEPASRQD